MKQIIEHFQHYFPGNNDDIRIYFAPGRVNLIGEHTDYNGGYVLPAALTMGTYMVVRPREDGWFQLCSANFDGDPVSFSVEDVVYDGEDPWGNYPKGIIWALFEEGVQVAGADIYYEGNIPEGAGLSSSAALGMVTAFGLAQLADAHLSIQRLVDICQRSENEFIGVNTGIMDQFAVGYGKKEHALLLHCETLASEEVPMPLDGYQLVITNTNKRRGLADSKYNERWAQCKQGLQDLQYVDPVLMSLGELTMSQFEQLQTAIEDPVVRRRVRHVVSENDRVKQACSALKQGDLSAFGEWMKQSHESLRDDYDVTGVELDTLFDVQKNIEGCIGTRMTGAGFGGCTVSIVCEENIPGFEQDVKKIYREKIGLAPSFYHCYIGDGVKELKREVV